MAVSVFFLLCRWTGIAHGNIVRSRNGVSHWCDVSLLGVAIVNFLLILLPFMVLCCILSSMVIFMFFTVFNMVSLVKKLDFFFYFSQTFVKIVFAMPSNVLVDLCFIYVCRLKSFRHSIKLFLFILFVLTPPVWIHNSVHRR